MATDTNQTDPYAQYNFEVEVDGKPVAGFAEVGGITMELETVPYREGGVNDRVHQLPGQFAHANLVLRRGLTKNTTFWEWIQTVMSGTLTRKNIVVTVKDGFRGESQWGVGVRRCVSDEVVWAGPREHQPRDGDRVDRVGLRALFDAVRDAGLAVRLGSCLPQPVRTPRSAARSLRRRHRRARTPRAPHESGRE